VELGRSPSGTWGLVEDQDWLNAKAGEALELLYFSEAEYQHAVRGLKPDERTIAVEHRRRQFASTIPSTALGLVGQSVHECLCLMPQAPESMRWDLLTAVASFTVLPRFARTAPMKLLDYLCEGDAAIVAELESASLRAAGNFEGAGAECEIRRRFGAVLGKMARPASSGGLPYHNVVRVYLVVPRDMSLERQLRLMGYPTARWRDGSLLPLSERDAGGLESCGQRASVVFPAVGGFMESLSDLSPAQRDQEFADRIIDPRFPAHVNGLRLTQATLRIAAHLLAGVQSELVAVLGQQVREEVAGLQAWLQMGQTAAPQSDGPSNLEETIARATLLASLCRRQGDEGEANRVSALARAVSDTVRGTSG
jgi:hypothetical protein